MLITVKGFVKYGFITIIIISLMIGLLSALSEMYLVRFGIRFATIVRPGKNELYFQLPNGIYVYQITTNYNISVVTISYPNEPYIKINTSIIQSNNIIKASTNQYDSFSIDHSSEYIKMLIENNSLIREPLYLSFRRGL
jgi:hypothetical protein